MKNFFIAKALVLVVLLASAVAAAECRCVDKIISTDDTSAELLMRCREPDIIILAFALLIQNTCPLGAVGKSTVFSSCENCPLKHYLILSNESQKNLAFDSSSVHFPIYVFSVPNVIHVFRLESVTSSCPLLTNRYEDAMPGEFLHPPRS